MLERDPFGPYLARWRLTPDGAPVATRSSRLLPVRRSGMPAMLKLALVEEEVRGGRQLAWWSGAGAARVLEREGGALLMERADEPAGLVPLALGGRDEDACRILCRVASRLHAPRPEPPSELVGLPRWFRALPPAAVRHGGVFREAHDAARALLDDPREVVPLHGDLHHGNVLRFGERGWLAIDPKGLVGERGFDFANLFCNPTLETAAAPGLFETRVRVVAGAAGLEPGRLLRWILAWCGLSGAWHLEDGTDPVVPLAVAALAAARLG